MSHLQEDMGEVCKVLCLPRCELPVENSQERGEYRGYYTSERLKVLVREVYARDFSITGAVF